MAKLVFSELISVFVTIAIIKSSVTKVKTVTIFIKITVSIIITSKITSTIFIRIIFVVAKFSLFALHIWIIFLSTLDLLASRSCENASWWFILRKRIKNRIDSTTIFKNFYYTIANIRDSYIKYWGDFFLKKTFHGRTNRKSENFPQSWWDIHLKIMPWPVHRISFREMNFVFQFV